MERAGKYIYVCLLCVCIYMCIYRHPCICIYWYVELYIYIHTCAYIVTCQVILYLHIKNHNFILLFSIAVKHKAHCHTTISICSQYKNYQWDIYILLFMTSHGKRLPYRTVQGQSHHWKVAMLWGTFFPSCWLASRKGQGTRYCQKLGSKSYICHL